MKLMNKVFTIIILNISILFAIGCQDNFLSEEPSSFLSPENFYETQEDAIAAVTFAYDGLASGFHGIYSRDLHWVLDFPTDEALGSGSAREEFVNYTYTADHRFLENLWEEFYDGINRCNAVIERVPKVDMNPDLKRRLVAETHFIRALHYFNMVRMWGEVPLEIEETTSLKNLEKERASIKEVYDLILEDLNKAESELPVSYSSEKYRATKGAAKSLLAKVYLTRATSEAAESTDFEMATQKAKEVIDMGIYGLFNDYADVFDESKENGIEHIFSVPHERDLKVSEQGHGHFLTPFGTVRGFPGGAGSWMFSTIEFFNSLEDGDYRKEAGFITEAELKATGEVVPWTEFPFPYPHTDKYTSEDGFDEDWHIIRYSEVLLIYAEALNEVNGGPTQEAYNAINEVRERARGEGVEGWDPVPGALPDLQGLNKEEFLEAVLQERQWELCFENKRWFDLVRRGKLIEVISSAFPDVPISEKHTRFPIPASQLQVNSKLEQNSGW